MGPVLGSSRLRHNVCALVSMLVLLGHLHSSSATNTTDRGPATNTTNSLKRLRLIPTYVIINACNLYKNGTTELPLSMLGVNGTIGGWVVKILNDTGCKKVLKPKPSFTGLNQHVVISGRRLLANCSTRTGSDCALYTRNELLEFRDLRAGPKPRGQASLGEGALRYPDNLPTQCRSTPAYPTYTILPNWIPPGDYDYGSPPKPCKDSFGQPYVKYTYFGTDAVSTTETNVCEDCATNNLVCCMGTATHNDWYQYGCGCISPDQGDNNQMEWVETNGCDSKGRCTSPDCVNKKSERVGEQTKECSCFPGSATVTLQSGQAKRMDQLAYGDKVLAVDRMTQQLVWRDVYLIAHRDPDATARYTHLLTNTGATLKLDPQHFIPVCTAGCEPMALQSGTAQLEHRYGRDVRVGDTVLVANPQAGLGFATVVDAYLLPEAGVYHPLVRGALIVVDGVAASPHASWFLDDITPEGWQKHLPAVYEALLTPVYLAYCLAGPSYCEFCHRVLVGTRSEGILELVAGTMAALFPAGLLATMCVVTVRRAVVSLPAGTAQ